MLKKNGYFITIVVQLYLRIRHQKGSTKPQGTESQRATSASGLCWLLIDCTKICYKNTEALLVARNIHFFVSNVQNAGQIVASLNQNCMHAETVSILKSGNMIQNFLFSILLSKIIKIKTYRTIGVKLGLLLHGKHKLRVLENRA